MTQRPLVIGDRVRVTKSSPPYYSAGDIGVVTDRDPSPSCTQTNVCLDLNNQGNPQVFQDGIWFAASEDCTLIYREHGDIVRLGHDPNGLRYLLSLRSYSGSDLHTFWGVNQSDPTSPRVVFDRCQNFSTDPSQWFYLDTLPVVKFLTSAEAEQMTNTYLKGHLDMCRFKTYSVVVELTTPTRATTGGLSITTDCLLRNRSVIRSNYTGSLEEEKISSYLERLVTNLNTAGLHFNCLAWSYQR